MFQIEGQILVVPLACRTEAGNVRVSDEGDQTPAVIQTFTTAAGDITVILQEENVQDIIDALIKAQNHLGEKPSGLYVPNSEAEVENLAKLTKDIHG